MALRSAGLIFAAPARTDSCTAACPPTEAPSYVSAQTTGFVKAVRGIDTAHPGRDVDVVLPSGNTLRLAKVKAILQAAP